MSAVPVAASQHRANLGGWVDDQGVDRWRGAAPKRKDGQRGHEMRDAGGGWARRIGWLEWAGSSRRPRRCRCLDSGGPAVWPLPVVVLIYSPFSSEESDSRVADVQAAMWPPRCGLGISLCSYFSDERLAPPSTRDDRAGWIKLGP